MSTRHSFEAITAMVQRLSSVEVHILHAVLRYPFLRAEDIAVARQIHIATVYRHLTQLHDSSLIECVIPAVLGTGSCSLYHLSNFGLHVLAASEHMDAQTLARFWHVDERSLLRLLPRLSLLVTLHTCINALVLHTPEALAQCGHPPVCRWHWLWDYHTRFTYRQQDLSCAADALLVLKVRPNYGDAPGMDTRWYSLLLFLDHNLNEGNLIHERLRRVLSYRESPLRRTCYHHFPLVLVLVTNPHRREHWQRAADEATRMAGTVFAELKGAIACLPDEPVTSHSNLWRLPWKTLAGNAPCHLQDLLVPLPLEAIPPGPLDEDLAADEETMAPRVVASIPPITSGNRRFTRIIAGAFATRAHDVWRGASTDQEEFERVGLLGLIVHRRHLELLTFCLNHPLLSAHDMAALLTLEEGTIERYLRELRTMGCLEREDTVAGSRWHLSERGLRLVAATHHVRISRLATATTPAKPGTEPTLVQLGLEEARGHIQHTAGIYGFFASLAQAARTRPDHRLLWWETGSICERRYRHHESWYNLRPDGAGEYQVGRQRVRFWLEWDRGTMVRRDLATKFLTYTRYVVYRSWVKEHTVLPMLLTVAPDIGQERRIRRVAEQELAHTPGLVMQSTTASLLATQGPLAPIWWPVATSRGPPASRTTFFPELPRDMPEESVARSL
jgi:predicted transcriptional regulator